MFVARAGTSSAGLRDSLEAAAGSLVFLELAGWAGAVRQPAAVIRLSYGPPPQPRAGP